MNPSFVKISVLLVVVILLILLYAVIIPVGQTGLYITEHEGFIEGNECTDVENRAKDKILDVLNTPVANTSDSPRMTAIDMISKIKKINSEVDNGTGDFKGNTKQCFPGRVKLNLDLDNLDPDSKIQKIRSSLVPEKLSDKS